MELCWEIVLENERWLLDKKWTPCPKLLIDPEHFTNNNYQKCPRPQQINLPQTEDSRYRWMWSGDWICSEWRHAISFAHFSTWSRKMSPQHFVRQRVWKRARIRRMKEGVTDVQESVIENQRRIAHRWASPYLPGDPPHYSSEGGRKNKTFRDVEQALPANWAWNMEWKVVINENTDKDGWQYSIADFTADDFSAKCNIVLHYVRKRKWIRTRVYQRELKGPPKLARIKSAPSEEVASPKNEIPTQPKIHPLDENWDDDEDEKHDPNTVVPINLSQQLSIAQPPFKIDICWNYLEIFQMLPKQDDVSAKKVYYRRHGLSIWCPNLGALSSTNFNDSTTDNETTGSNDTASNPWYFLGHIMEEYQINPQYTVPSLIVQNGTDSKALVPPENLKVMHYRKVTPKSNSKSDMHRYWLEILPPKGYEALGSVAVQLKDAIPEKYLPNNALTFLKQDPSAKILLERLACLRSDYAQDQYPYVSHVLLNKQEKFYVLRPQPQVISGVPKTVEMPMVTRMFPPRKTFTERELQQQNEEESMQIRLGKGIKPECLAKADAARLCEITIVVDAPLIVSAATVFNCVWSSRSLTESSNTRCSVWEPVLGKDEYMVGHLAIADWQHPAAVSRNKNVLILKTGGSDPDAFKEPLGFECIWNAQQSIQKNQLKGLFNFSQPLQEHVPSGSFWRAIPPQGYVALGDIALPIDGVVGGKNEHMLPPSEMPKYVCVKREYASFIKQVAKESVGTQSTKISRRASVSLLEAFKKETGEETVEIRNRDEIWSSATCHSIQLHGKIYSQPSFSNEINSPMLCCNAEGLNAENVLPVLQVTSCVESEAAIATVRSGYLQKKGKEVVTKKQKRFCVLTTQKELSYYDGIDCKNVVSLTKMKEVGVVDGSKSQKFNLVIPDRTFVFETENADAMEWVAAIQEVYSSQITDVDQGSSLLDRVLNIKGQQASGSVRASTVAVAGSLTEADIHEGKTEEEHICALLKLNLDKLEAHLRQNNQVSVDFETDSTVYKAIQWYEELANLKGCIEILLSKWPLGSVCPPEVLPVRLAATTLMEEIESVIMNDILCYAQTSFTENTLVRLHSACLAMSELRRGQMRVATYITDQLLTKTRTAFAPGSRDATLENIDRRFTDYRRIMSEYDRKFLSFIPLWWGLPTQIASLFCSLMSTQLDEQLTQYPEKRALVITAREKAQQFENELMRDAMKRLTMTEIDVRSWAKGDPGEPQSWIKIDNKNKLLYGKGLGCVCLDIYTKNITQQKTFDFNGKKVEVNKEFDDFLKSIDDHWLVIMVAHDTVGTISKSCIEILTNWGVSEEQIPRDSASFVYIGRPSKVKSDPFFICTSYASKAGPCNIRRIITPYIPNEQIAERVTDTSSIPFYTGILTQILDRHLEMYVGEEAETVQANLASVLQTETFYKLKETHLQAVQKSDNHEAHLKSITDIGNSINAALRQTITITRGRPVTELFKKFVTILEEYGNLLVRLVNDGGGEALKQALSMPLDFVSILDANISKNAPERNTSLFESKWNNVDLQYFIVFVCMAFNTCRKTREFAQDMKRYAQNAVEPKHKNAIDIKSLTIHFLSIEDELLQILRATILTKFSVIVQFHNNTDWNEQKYSVEIKERLDTWLGNCKKLLPRPVFTYFLKLLTAHFVIKFLRGLYFSRVFATPESTFFSPLPKFEQCIIGQLSDQLKITQTILKKMTSVPGLIVELGFANAGDKYQSKASNNPSTGSNVFGRFFNRSSTRAQPASAAALSNQLAKRIKTEIANTTFAKKAIEFYSNKELELNPLSHIQDYPSEFADLDEEEDLNIDSQTTQQQKKSTEIETKENEQQVSSNLSSGFTLSMASAAWTTTTRMNRKYEIIRQIMLMRGFDEMDQQTIQMMCEDSDTKPPPPQDTQTTTAKN